VTQLRLIVSVIRVKARKEVSKNQLKLILDAWAVYMVWQLSFASCLG